MSAVLPNSEKKHTEDMWKYDESSNETLPLHTNTGTLPENRLETEEVEQIQGLYEKIKSKSVLVPHIAESKELIKLEKCLLTYKVLLSDKS